MKERESKRVWASAFFRHLVRRPDGQRRRLVAREVQRRRRRIGRPNTNKQTKQPTDKKETTEQGLEH